MEAERDEKDRLTAQIDRRLYIIALLDCYGSLLKERQRNLLDLYYNQDLSLSELAEGQRISRQAVHEAIKRGEGSLCDYEVRLGFLKKQRDWQMLTEEVGTWPIQGGEIESLREMWLERAESLL